MTTSNAAPTMEDLRAPLPPEQSAVKQWFRGEIEASYYGIQSRVPAMSSDSVGRRYRLHIYRAAVLRADLLVDDVVVGDAGTAGTQTPDTFFQASIETAQLWGVRGPGTRYEGPIHDVTITKMETHFHVVKDGKSYGTLRGNARGWFYLPPATVPEPLLPVHVDHAERIAKPGVLIRESPPESAVKETVAADQAPIVDRKREVDRTARERDAPDASVDDADAAPARRRASSQKTDPPYFSLCAAVGLLLWFACSAEQTWIWCLFMLPTLGMRRLVLDVVPDERGVQAFAAVMVLGAILSAGTIFASFRSESCWTLEAVPLSILVGSVFLSGIVPYRLPLAITALTFAGVLYGWGHAPERHCPSESPSESLPTIKDPGVPRTNDDGTWPRRPPTTENTP